MIGLSRGSSGRRRDWGSTRSRASRAFLTIGAALMTVICGALLGATVAASAGSGVNPQSGRGPVGPVSARQQAAATPVSKATLVPAAGVSTGASDNAAVISSGRRAGSASSSRTPRSVSSGSRRRTANAGTSGSSPRRAATWARSSSGSTETSTSEPAREQRRARRRARSGSAHLVTSAPRRATSRSNHHRFLRGKRLHAPRAKSISRSRASTARSASGATSPAVPATRSGPSSPVEGVISRPATSARELHRVQQARARLGAVVQRQGRARAGKVAHLAAVARVTRHGATKNGTRVRSGVPARVRRPPSIAAGAVYHRVVGPRHARTRHVTVQLPTTRSASARRAPTHAAIAPQTVARAVSSALQSLASLVQTGGGGFGRRLEQQFPLGPALLGIAAMALGSALSVLRLARRVERG